MCNLKRSSSTAVLQRATELDENDVEAVFQCGLCFARLEHIQEAKPYFEKVLEMDEEHADAYYNLGVAYVFEENNEKALALFKKATEIQPHHFLAGNGVRLLEQEAE